MEYFERVRGGEQAVLQGVLTPAKFHPTSLSFTYRLFESEKGNLTVSQYLYDKDGNKVIRNLWSQSGDQGNTWHTASVKVGPIQPYVKSRIYFVATVGRAWQNVAIDSIVLS